MWILILSRRYRRLCFVFVVLTASISLWGFFTVSMGNSSGIGPRPPYCSSGHDRLIVQGTPQIVAVYMYINALGRSRFALRARRGQVVKKGTSHQFSAS